MGDYLPYIARTEQEAWTAFMVACAMPDKQGLTTNEAHRITQLQFRTTILPDPINNHIYGILSCAIQNVGAIAMIDGAIGRIHKDDYQTLFTYCCEVIYADGLPNEARQKVLYHIGYVLNITKSFFSTCTTYQRFHCAKDDRHLFG